MAGDGNSQAYIYDIWHSGIPSRLSLISLGEAARASCEDIPEAETSSSHRGYFVAGISPIDCACDKYVEVVRLKYAPCVAVAYLYTYVLCEVHAYDDGTCMYAKLHNISDSRPL